MFVLNKLSESESESVFKVYFRVNDILYINKTTPRPLKRVYFRMILVHLLLLRTEFQVNVSLHLCFLQ